MKEIQKPLVNWGEIEKILFSRMRPFPPGTEDGKGGDGHHVPGKGIGAWDSMSANYNRMIHMENRFTLNQVDCFDTSFENAHRSERSHPPMPRMDRRLGNNVLYNKVYDLGYEPNVRIVDDGFEKVFGSRNEAYAELLKLSREPKGVNQKVFKNNADKYIEDREDGSVYFLAKTKTMVLWFEPTRPE